MMTEDAVMESLVEPICDHLVPILEETLNTSAERHALAHNKGADGFSFGTDAWSLPARRFRELAEEGTIPFDVISDDGCVLIHKEQRIRHHRVGASEHDDINASFPRNAKAAARETYQQYTLPFNCEPSEGSKVTSGTVVLAYMANANDGLCAVYLTRVGEVLKGKVVRWSCTRE
ncbi:MAG: hypothetical protein GY700_15615, partial [Propionibacteriaceae bacterium]|nr:hypothetical protein [Propionibacteriaceae bacterium]